MPIGVKGRRRKPFVRLGSYKPTTFRWWVVDSSKTKGANFVPLFFYSFHLSNYIQKLTNGVQSTQYRKIISGEREEIMLNKEVLLNFAKKEEGKQLIHVFEAIGSYLAMMSAIKDIKDCPDSGLTLQEAVSKAAERLCKAVFRILQYNSICKESTGEFFLTRKINRSSVEDCQKLVKCFTDAIVDNAGEKAKLYHINAA